jgi:hypothetical protein
VSIEVDIATSIKLSTHPTGIEVAKLRGRSDNTQVERER